MNQIDFEFDFNPEILQKGISLKRAIRSTKLKRINASNIIKYLNKQKRCYKINLPTKRNEVENLINFFNTQFSCVEIVITSNRVFTNFTYFSGDIFQIANSILYSSKFVPGN